MKIMNKYFCGLIIIISALASCEDMMDVHKKFIKDGEIVYAPNLDSLCFYAGENKVYLQFWTFNAVNVTNVGVYWDEDSLIIPVSPSSGLDSMMVEVPCTEEKSYTLKVRATDIFKNHSLWNTGFANSYGNFFRQSIANRYVKNFAVSGNNGEINWFPPATNLVRSEIRYQDAGKINRVIKVPAGQNTTVCPGLNDNRFEVRSFYLPEPNAVDTFTVDWEQVHPVYQYIRTGWSIKYCNSWHGMPSTTESSNMPQFIIDGKFVSFWHSRYLTYVAGTNPLDPTITRDPCPHTIVIDMGEPLDITQVDIYRRLNNTDIQTVIVYASNVADNLLTEADFQWLGNTPVSYTNHEFFKNYRYTGVENNRWTELGRCEYQNDAQATAELNQKIIDASSKNIKSRYLKLILPNTRSNANVSVAEIIAWGR